jgi:hypothetical protein
MAVIVVVSLLVAFGIGGFVLPDRGRIVFFCTCMILVCLYSTAKMIKVPLVTLLVAAYIAFHLAVVFLPGATDDAYYGAFLLPLAIVDYIAMLYALEFTYNRASRN